VTDNRSVDPLRISLLNPQPRQSDAERVLVRFRAGNLARPTP